VGTQSLSTLKPFGGQVVDMGRGRAAQGAAAVAAQFPPSQVVGHDQYDIGLFVHALRLPFS
jgi:hypothetical protein